MAELVVDPNIIDPILSPDGQQDNKDYEAARPEMQADLALGEIDSLSGFTDFLQPHIDSNSGSRFEWRNKHTAREVASNFSNRIDTVLGSYSTSMIDRFDGETASLASIDKQVWRYRASNVRNDIMNASQSARISMLVSDLVSLDIYMYYS